LQPSADNNLAEHRNYFGCASFNFSTYKFLSKTTKTIHYSEKRNSQPTQNPTRPWHLALAFTKINAKFRIFILFS